MTTTTNDPRAYLEGVLAKADAATQGPWGRGEGSSYYVVEHEDFGTIAETYCTNDAEDANFIASARTTSPTLARALLTVLDRHKPRYDLKTPAGTTPVCDVCGDPDGWADPWPCADVRIITTELAKEVTK